MPISKKRLREYSSPSNSLSSSNNGNQSHIAPNSPSISTRRIREQPKTLPMQESRSSPVRGHGSNLPHVSMRSIFSNQNALGQPRLNESIVRLRDTGGHNLGVDRSSSQPFFSRPNNHSTGNERKSESPTRKKRRTEVGPPSPSRPPSAGPSQRRQRIGSPRLNMYSRSRHNLGETRPSYSDRNIIPPLVNGTGLTSPTNFHTPSPMYGVTTGLYSPYFIPQPAISGIGVQPASNHSYAGRGNTVSTVINGTTYYAQASSSPGIVNSSTLPASSAAPENRLGLLDHARRQSTSPGWRSISLGSSSGARGIQQYTPPMFTYPTGPMPSSAPYPVLLNFLRTMIPVRNIPISPMRANNNQPSNSSQTSHSDGFENENYEQLLSLAERLGDGRSRGMSRQEIERIPSYKYRVERSPSGSTTQTSCVICICDFKQCEALRVLPCYHEFHRKCVEKWLKSNRTCPVCRGDASEPFSF